ncbi:hypothetical protein ACFSGI_16395 [Paenibacillus nicotianae]|uniref:Uncharacterized protein n=1 Tax=Paenibacillus nicotianae TaxID=1526551 RepID=A0ABW4UVM8_9BACL
MDYQAKTDWSYNDTVTEQDMNRIEAGLGDLHERLDVDSYEQLTLKPGLQIVNAKKNSPFQLTGLKGRTLINLLGRTGGMESLNGIFVHKGNMVLDSINKTLGENSLKVTSAAQSEGDSGIAYIPINNLKSGSYYVVIADVKNGNNANGIYVGWGGGFGGSYTSATIAGNQFTTVWKKFSPTTVLSGNIDLAVQSIAGKYGYFDSVRVYELNSDEYKSIDNLTADQVNQYYPYVDSISPVRNPYAIAYGENLLPALQEQEWKNSEGTPVVNNRYSVDVSNTNKMILSYIDVIPGAIYTLSAISSASTGRIFVYNMNASVPLADTVGNGLISATFTVPSGVNVVEVRLLGTSPATVNLSNIMLNTGGKANLFKPREDSMLALQTDLYANPVTGEDADEVFERDGQYFRLTKWKKLLLDEKLNWQPFASLAGIKIVRVDASNFNTIFDDASTYFATKYDGAILDHKFSTDSKDQVQLNTTNEGKRLFISISATDSGWGDNYTPTKDEIKAYFLGWRMYDSSDSSGNTSYNRTDGTKKAWTVLASYNNTDYSGSVTIVPNTKPELINIVYRQIRDVSPYQLVYKLNQPIIEPITSEGQIDIVLGDNQVEVGVGIVLREMAKPQITVNAYFINAPGIVSSYLRNKVSKFLAIYKNNHRDIWGWENVNITGAQAGLDAYKYDENAAYTTTYIMQKKYPVPNFNGYCATNEKSLLSNMLDIVNKNTTRLSVVENKKADIENSSWIQPTFQSSWSPFTTGYTNGYKKIAGTNMVVFHFCLYGGLTSIGTVFFRFPENYRPKQNVIFTGFSRNGDSSVLATTAFEIRSTGYALVGTGVPQNGAYMVSGIFEAEQ